MCWTDYGFGSSISCISHYNFVVIYYLQRVVINRNEVGHNGGVPVWGRARQRENTVIE